jgi:Zn-dependent protease with chaperone function
VNVFIHGAFNLIVNAMLAFAGALGVTIAVTTLLRVRSGRALVAFLCMPFLKVFHDIALGIAPSSFFWKRLEGVRQELGSFRIGFGIASVPFDLRLSSLYRGRWYPLSAADLVDTVLTVKVSRHAPAFVVIALSSVGVFLLLRRWLAWRRFSRIARAHRIGARLIDTRRFRRADVPVLVSPNYSGPPFAAGLLRPYVLFSEESVRHLSDEQRIAVIEHELAHVRHLDVLLVGALSYLAALFWFLPGVSWLVARVRAHVELSADDAAVRAGADPVVLASALLTVAEALMSEPEAELAVGRTESSLAVRATRLLSSREGERGASRVLRLIALGLVAAGVLNSVFLGNHTQAFH